MQICNVIQSFHPVVEEKLVYNILYGLKPRAVFCFAQTSQAGLKVVERLFAETDYWAKQLGQDFIYPESCRNWKIHFNTYKRAFKVEKQIQSLQFATFQKRVSNDGNVCYFIGANHAYIRQPPGESLATQILKINAINGKTKIPFASLKNFHDFAIQESSCLWFNREKEWIQIAEKKRLTKILNVKDFTIHDQILFVLGGAGRFKLYTLDGTRKIGKIDFKGNVIAFRVEADSIYALLEDRTVWKANCIREDGKVEELKFLHFSKAPEAFEVRKGEIYLRHKNAVTKWAVSADQKEYEQIASIPFEKRECKRVYLDRNLLFIEKRNGEIDAWNCRKLKHLGTVRVPDEKYQIVDLKVREGIMVVKSSKENGQLRFEIRNFNIVEFEKKQGIVKKMRNTLSILNPFQKAE